MSQDIDDEHLEQGTSMGESTNIHMDIIRETGDERVPGPMGIDVDTA